MYLKTVTLGGLEGLDDGRNEAGSLLSKDWQYEMSPVASFSCAIVKVVLKCEGLKGRWDDCAEVCDIVLGTISKVLDIVSIESSKPDDVNYRKCWMDADK